ncbi:unnamed protein product [Spirodela intermedia]|uniref:Malectin-like domain-containing protein n=1 Tax=Spirodela intermedia TaxID=51605 RepID=A0ABN7EDR0_SPIIN|nr:unnamed protein product [Spirodela intermedia]
MTGIPLFRLFRFRDSNYTDSTTKIIYSPDALYIDTGENRRVSPETNLTGLFEYYKTSGASLMERGTATLRNFDGRNSPPTFDVYLGIHFWWTVPPDDFSRLEIIVVSPGESMQVCLVNKGGDAVHNGTGAENPTGFDLPLVNTSQALVLRGDRRDHGINGSRRSCSLRPSLFLPVYIYTRKYIHIYM